MSSSQPSPDSLPYASTLPHGPYGPCGGIFAELLEKLPEFAPIFWDVEQSSDGDPQEPVVLAELADFVSNHLAVLESTRSVLERTVQAVEHLIADLDDDELGSELIGFAFFDALSQADRRTLGPRLGARSRQLLEALDHDIFE